MFKKLKQKLEEGGDGGIEKVSFKEKLPGSVVRTSDLNNGHSRTSSRVNSFLQDGEDSSGGTYSKDQVSTDQDQYYSQPTSDSENVVSEESLQWDLQGPSENIPRHLISQPPLSYQALLEARVEDLERECGILNKDLNSAAEDHASQRASYEEKFIGLDQQVTNMKMQLFEAELERASLQHDHEGVVTDLHRKIELLETQVQQEKHNHQETSNRLQTVVDQRDQVIVDLEDEVTDLKKKTKHLSAQLEAFEKHSEDVAVSRLHSEVADVERRVQSRNVEIQILERRLAAQAKERDEQAEMLISRLEDLEKKLRASEESVTAERASCRSVQRDLESEQARNRDLSQQVELLQTKLNQHHAAQQQLEAKMQEIESAHLQQVHDLEACVADRDSQVKSLQQQVRDQQFEGVPLQPMLHPPGLVHRTVSVGVQTSQFLQDDLDGTQTLGTAGTCNQEREEGTDIQGPANMITPTAVAELQTLRSLQNQIEEELAEKMKILKVQQQTIMDLKKELRVQQRNKEEPVREKSHSPSPPIRVAIASDVNFQYLKHVVIRFMCSHTEEALQLTKAIATLLEFSPQEEQHVKNYLNYKMSWFGSVPPPLFTPLPLSKQ